MGTIHGFCASSHASAICAGAAHTLDELNPPHRYAPRIPGLPGIPIPQIGSLKG
jgi:hypothetical protein